MFFRHPGGFDSEVSHYSQLYVKVPTVHCTVYMYTVPIISWISSHKTKPVTAHKSDTVPGFWDILFLWQCLYSSFNTFDKDIINNNNCNNTGTGAEWGEKKKC